MNEIFAFIVDKFFHDMFINDKSTQDTFETFNWEILDVILLCIPVDDMFVQLMFVEHVLILLISLIIYTPDGTWYKVIVS